MKLKNLKEKTFEGNDFVFEGIDAKINPEQLQKMMELFSSPYKDSISSIVREITSNCFDSHKEAKVNDAVIITLSKDDSGEYIMFSDVGTGLSPERIEKIYINYLTSTKEDSNDFIGAFGIGSKSPLSYRDMFFINTVYEGIKYEYIMRKGDTVPRIEKLNETAIDQRNGTDIKIYIKQNQTKNNDNYYLGDVGYFIKAIENQLKYFDNVYIKNELEYLSQSVKSKITFLNNFKIYEGKNYIHRSNSTGNLEICLGKVYYPIDYKIVFPELNGYISLPVALKFDIGDLMVTFSREDIKYTPDTISLIRKKTKDVIEEIVNTFIEQSKNENKSYDNYYEFIKQSLKNRSYVVKYKDFDLDINPLLSSYFKLNVDGKKYNVSNGYFSDLQSMNYVRNFNEKDFNIISNNSLSQYIGNLSFDIPFPYFKPFESTTLKNDYNSFNDLFTKVHIKQSSNVNYSPKKSVKNDNSYLLNTVDNSNYVNIYQDKDIRLTSVMKAYIDEELVDKTKRVKITVFKLRRKLDAYKALLNSDSSIYKRKDEWRNWIKIIQKNIEQSFIEKSYKLSDIEKKATKEWYAGYKKKHGLVVQKAKVVKEPDSIHFKSLTNYKSFSINSFVHFPNIINISSTFSSGDLNIKDYEKNFPSIKKENRKIFLTKEESSIIKQFNLFKDLYVNIKQKPLKNNIYIISKTNKKMIDEKKINYSVDDFIKDNLEDFIDLYSTLVEINKDGFKIILDSYNKYVSNEKLLNSIILYSLFKKNDILDQYIKNENNILKIKQFVGNETDNHLQVVNLTLFYKNLLEKLIKESNLSTTLQKEVDKRQDKIKKEVKNYTDFLEDKYLDLYKISRIEKYSNNHLSNSKKEIILDFKIIDNDILEKDSFFYKLKEEVSKNKYNSTLELQSFVSKELEPLVKIYEQINPGYGKTALRNVKDQNYAYVYLNNLSEYISLYIYYLLEEKNKINPITK